MQAPLSVLRRWLAGGALLGLVGTGAAAELTGDRFPAQGGEVVVHPIAHATLVLGWRRHVIYVDPVGGAAPFAGLPAPTLVLLTHEHFDHLNVDTLLTVTRGTTRLVAPAAVVAKLPKNLRAQTRVLANGQQATVDGLKIAAIPAYNTTADRRRYHPKGRDNGYVLTLGGRRLYLSGDTEDIPEMRGLKNIDIAFVCMNLPYTMTVEQAADAVRAFRPKVVYPYHYRGSDLEKFRRLVGRDAGVEVRPRDWYRKQAAPSTTTP